MGLLFSKVLNLLLEDKSIGILILGLDNSGKTSILYKLYQKKVIQIIPTMGFNVETLTYNNLKFKVWDVAGQSELRQYWRAYFQNKRGIIYVVDSSDKGRLKLSREELMNVLKDEELKNAPLLILANKQDVQGALSQTKICEYLKLNELKSRKWRIFKCSALTGLGLSESMEWMANTIGK